MFTKSYDWVRHVPVFAKIHPSSLIGIFSSESSESFHQVSRGINTLVYRWKRLILRMILCYLISLLKSFLELFIFVSEQLLFQCKCRILMWFFFNEGLVGSLLLSQVFLWYHFFHLSFLLFLKLSSFKFSSNLSFNISSDLFIHFLTWTVIFCWQVRRWSTV